MERDDLVPMWVPKKLDLPQHDIDRLEREKSDLLKVMQARLVSDAPKPKIEPGAIVEFTPQEISPNVLHSRITADGRKLANLASMARRLEEIADRNAEKANASREIANRARNELSAYMREHGLA